MDDLRQSLARFPSAASHPILQAALDGLPAGAISLLELESGERLTEAGSLDERLFVVLDGQLAVMSQDGLEVGKTFLPGDVCGEVGYLTGMPRSASIEARTRTAVVAITGELTDGTTGDLRRLASERFKASMLVEVLIGSYGIADADSLQEFAAAANVEEIEAGTDLFAGRKGELALVLLGSFHVTTEEKLIAKVGRGEILGEMSWLNERRRSADVVARKDSIVARFPAAEFERLALRHPNALLAVTKTLAHRLSRNPIYRRSKPPRPMSVAVIACHASIDARSIAQQLADNLPKAAVITTEQIDQALARPGISSEPIGSPRGLAVDTWMTLDEPRHEISLLVGDGVGSNWNNRVVRHADRVMILLDATEPPDITAAEHDLAGEFSTVDVELMLVHPPSTGVPSGTASWLQLRQAHRHHHIRTGNGRDLARAARRLAGLARGLVIGGGGARGYSAIGVSHALDEAGFDIDVLGGTSMGSLIAGGIAFGGSGFIDEMAGRYGSKNYLHDTTLPLASIFASRRVTQMLQNEFADARIEDLWTPFFAVATNLTNAEEVVIDRGPLWEAVRASIAIPGVFSPISRSGDLLVDGGIMNNLPIDVMRRYCEQGPVLAVNVSPRISHQSWDIEPYQSGWSILANRLNPFGATKRTPSIAGTVLRSLDTNSVSRLRQYEDVADLVIVPDVKEFSILDWDSHKAVIERGREAGRQAMSEWSA